MLEIKCNPATLTETERNYMADFLLNYPTVIVNTPEAIEHAKLAAEQTTDPIALFDPTSPPLPLGATAAPCSAGVEASRTALEVGGSAITGNDLSTNAPSLLVPSNVQTVGIAAPQANSPVPLDSEGLPWDDRIHTSARSKIANGTWKLKRGGDPAQVAAVKAELKSLMNVPNVQVNNGTFLQPPISNAVPPPPPVESLIIRDTFVDFIQDITEQLGSGKLTMGEITQCCSQVGIAAPNLLASRPDLIPTVATAISKIIASK